jgi:hypothetical protein
VSGSSQFRAAFLEGGDGGAGFVGTGTLALDNFGRGAVGKLLSYSRRRPRRGSALLARADQYPGLLLQWAKAMTHARPLCMT